MDAYKCRKCRTVLFTAENLVDAHGRALVGCEDTSDQCSQEYQDILFISGPLPEWIQKAIDEAEWTKGRLTCPTDMCLARVGIFNYVNSQPCHCKLAKLLPNIQVSRSRIDEPVLSSPESISSNKV